MEFKHFRININEIIPSQHFLSFEKYEKVKAYMENEFDYGVIFVIEYKNKIFSVDGHHRLYYLYEQGIKNIKVVCEVADNDSYLYKTLADESLVMGFTSIADLKSRFTYNYEEYKKLWIDKCQKILEDNKE